MGRLKYHVITGTLLLAGGMKISGHGETDDEKVQEQLRDLAGYKTGLGYPAYVVIEEEGGDGGAGDGGHGAGGDDQTSPPPADPPAVTIPDTVDAKQAETVAAALEAAGLTWESANALSDADIKHRTEGIGAGRITLIRTVGAANNFPAFTPAPE